MSNETFLDVRRSAIAALEFELSRSAPLFEAVERAKSKSLALPDVEPYRVRFSLDASPGARLFDALIHNAAFVEAMRALLVESPERWITSEEAARIMGFSRTYTLALLDSTEFAGNVRRSRGGHRRVSEKAVREWMEANGVSEELSERERRAMIQSFSEIDNPEADSLSGEDAEKAKGKIAEFRERSLSARPRRA